jgi:N-methylhydantoinase B
VIAPNGMEGGGEGRTGDIRINPGTPEEKQLPTRYADFPLKAGDVFRLETPGGGGWGEAHTREPQAVLQDVREGYVSAARAAEAYGVVVHGEGRAATLDEVATAKLRV